MERPTGVLLDVDGTLVDSNDAHAHAWVKALAEATAAVRQLPDGVAVAEGIKQALKLLAKP